jgi:hypothetical protein
MDLGGFSGWVGMLVGIEWIGFVSGISGWWLLVVSTVCTVVLVKDVGVGVDGFG